LLTFLSPSIVEYYFILASPAGLVLSFLLLLATRFIVRLEFKRLQVNEGEEGRGREGGRLRTSLHI
jgi:hypothetical protein